MQATTFFTTEHAQRYLGTLCKHFGHKVPTSHEAGSGRIELPFGLCLLSADATGLGLSVSAEDRPGLDRAVEVISSHLDRFAFRENPELSWEITEGTGA
ncbi:DUF2218 domain-containing protein [Amaricoccus tamworthensis]|uniref:DUF2218 domain-containing protein n=1 Tax=Amaricoccus tamworthensis TaxID=57002 RepID=UPI003C7DC52B